MSKKPRVRVVVVNYDGGELTISCLQSLFEGEWPADKLDVVLVDNGSIDGVARSAKKRFPCLTVLEPLENLGFGGGSNLGIEAPGEYDYVALLNPDAEASPQWLNPLVEALETDQTLGAASPKMVFAAQCRPVNITVPNAGRLSKVDARDLGVRLVEAEVTINGEVQEGELRYGQGWYGMETPSGDEVFATWSGKEAVLMVSGEGKAQLRLRLSHPKTTEVILETSDETMAINIGPGSKWVTLELPAKNVDVIQNAGSELHVGGHGGDRGFRQLDRGQFDEAMEVFSWCGGAVLLRPEYLNDVGMFDAPFFLYYEDLDLAWRGQRRGWEYFYVPAAVVRHHHAQSTGEWSPLFRFHVERNRLLTLVKNAPFACVIKEIGRAHIRLLRSLGRDLVLPILRLKAPQMGEPRQIIQFLLSFWRLFPSMLWFRCSDRPEQKRKYIYKKAVMQ